MPCNFLYYEWKLKTRWVDVRYLFFVQRLTYLAWYLLCITKFTPISTIYSLRCHHTTKRDSSYDRAKLLWYRFAHHASKFYNEQFKDRTTLRIKGGGEQLSKVFNLPNVSSQTMVSLLTKVFYNYKNLQRRTCTFCFTKCYVINASIPTFLHSASIVNKCLRVFC